MSDNYSHWRPLVGNCLSTLSSEEAHSWVAKPRNSLFTDLNVRQWVSSATFLKSTDLQAVTFAGITANHSSMNPHTAWIGIVPLVSEGGSKPKYGHDRE